MYYFLEATGTPTGGASAATSLIMIVAMLAIFYFFMYRPQKKQEKETNSMRNNLQVGDEITTIGGIIGKIVSINQEKGLSGYDADGRSLIPGLIEVHAHGCIGMDTLDGDFAPMCDFMAKSGTTTWLPTTMTVDTETLIEVTHKKTDFPGCHIPGFHLEGPYISPKYKGAQNEAYIKAPTYEEFSKFNNVKMITVAPEQPGSMEFIRRISAEGVVASIGHSDANYDTSIEAIEAGVTCLTHTFNRMLPLHHRDPGPIAAGAEKGIWAQMITDGIHVHKSMILAALKMYGIDRMTLISDSIRPAGLPEGTVSQGRTELATERMATMKEFSAPIDRRSSSFAPDSIRSG